MEIPFAGLLIVQQTAKQGVTWELRKPVSGQYACINLLGQEDPSLNVKLQCQELMVSGKVFHL